MRYIPFMPSIASASPKPTVPTPRPLLTLLAFVAMSVVGCQCASNPEVVSRGDAGPRDGDIVLQDGRIIEEPGVTGPCGAHSEQCCTGQACDAPLRCCGNGQCLGVSRYQGCTGDGDCCPGLVCTPGGECLSPSGGPCLGSSDCEDNLSCLEGFCGGPPTPNCGDDGEPCCPRIVDGEQAPYCLSGFVCNGDSGGDCTACGTAGTPCCDGEVRCPGDERLVCLVRQTGDPANPAVERCEIPVACGGIGEQCCAGDGCDVGALCDDDSGTCISEETGCRTGVEANCCGETLIRDRSPTHVQRCCEGQVCDVDHSCVSIDAGITIAGDEPNVDHLRNAGVQFGCYPLADVKQADSDDPEGDGDCGEEKGDRCCFPGLTCGGDLNCQPVSARGTFTCDECSNYSCGTSQSDCCGAQTCRDGRCCGTITCNPNRGADACCGFKKCVTSVPGIPFLTDPVGFCQPPGMGEACQIGDCAAGLTCEPAQTSSVRRPLLLSSGFGNYSAYGTCQQASSVGSGNVGDPCDGPDACRAISILVMGSGVQCTQTVPGDPTPRCCYEPLQPPFLSTRTMCDGPEDCCGNAVCQGGICLNP